MPEITTEDIIKLGFENAQQAVEYLMAALLPGELSKATEDERKAFVTAMAATMAALNVYLRKSCHPNVFREAQALTISFMELRSAAIDPKSGGPQQEAEAAALLDPEEPEPDQLEAHWGTTD